MWYLRHTCRQVPIESCTVLSLRILLQMHTDSLTHHDVSVCKTPRCIAGLWHADEESIVNMLLEKACEGLNQALATGDRYRARLLLRLLAGLTTANVVSMPSMFATLTHIVSTAVQVLQGALEAGMPRFLHLRVQQCARMVLQQAQSWNTCMLCYGSQNSPLPTCAHR